MKLGVSILPELLPQRADLAEYFDFWVPERGLRFDKFSHPEPGEICDRTYRKAKRFMDAANQYNKPVFAHSLIWHPHSFHKNPAWFKDASLDTIRDTLQKLVALFPEITDWVVLNEPTTSDGELRHSDWYKKLGEDLFSTPFFWIAEANPNARLWVNDYLPRDRRRWETIAKRVQEERSRGVPIHGVGIQYHVSYFPTPVYRHLRNAIRIVRDRNPDIDISLSEVAVDIQRDKYHTRRLANKIVPLQTRFQIQADIFGNIWNVGKEEGCQSMCIWGLWDRGRTNYMKRPDRSTLFDEEGNPKPAFYTLQEKRNGGRHEKDGRAV